MIVSHPAKRGRGQIGLVQIKYTHLRDNYVNESESNRCEISRMEITQNIPNKMILIRVDRTDARYYVWKYHETFLFICIQETKDQQQDNLKIEVSLMNSHAVDINHRVYKSIRFLLNS